MHPHHPSLIQVTSPPPSALALAHYYLLLTNYDYLKCKLDIRHLTHTINKPGNRKKTPTEYNKLLHQPFVDYKKASDSLKQEAGENQGM